METHAPTAEQRAADVTRLEEHFRRYPDPIDLRITVEVAAAALAAVQLGLRGPELTGPIRQYAETFARSFVQILGHGDEEIKRILAGGPEP